MFPDDAFAHVGQILIFSWAYFVFIQPLNTISDDARPGLDE